MRIGVIISDEPRINDEIRVSQVRLIGPNGEQVGVIATSVALNLAKEANLDLVEVAPNAKPPVAKLIDYGKYKYNEKIKAREARRNQSTAEIKEIRFRLKIDDHDFEVKKGHVVRFLNAETRSRSPSCCVAASSRDRLAASSCCSDLPAKWRNTAPSNSLRSRKAATSS